MPNANFSHEPARGFEKFSDVAFSTKENLDASLRWHDRK